MLKKSTSCLIKTDSRCAADHTSKTTFFILHFPHNTKILRENQVSLFVIWLVQWWKLYCIYIPQIKKNMNDGTIVFLTPLLIALTLLKETVVQVFSCEFFKISKKSFSKNTSGSCFCLLKTPFHCVISNFEKKKCLLLTKDFFSWSFQSCKFFSRKGELCKKCNLKAARSN